MKCIIVIVSVALSHNVLFFLDKVNPGVNREDLHGFSTAHVQQTRWWCSCLVWHPHCNFVKGGRTPTKITLVFAVPL